MDGYQKHHCSFECTFGCGLREASNQGAILVADRARAWRVSSIADQVGCFSIFTYTARDALYRDAIGAPLKNDPFARFVQLDTSAREGSSILAMSVRRRASAPVQVTGRGPTMFGLRRANCRWSVETWARPKELPGHLIAACRLTC